MQKNRIVVSYDFEDLVLLGGVGIDSGRIYGPNEIPAGEWWPGPKTEVFDCHTYADALSIPPRPNAEGVVVRTSDGRMQKIKQEDYIRLHAIITRLNARSVWELMMQDKCLAECVEGIPDEFHGFVKDVYAFISNQVDNIESAAHGAYLQIKSLSIQDAEVFGGNKRKAFALLAKDHPMSGYLFRLYDGKDIRPEILKNARPAADWTPVKLSADAA